VPEDLPSRLVAAGVQPGAYLAVAVSPAGVGFATGDHRWHAGADDPAGVVAAIEAALAPRWVWWTSDTPAALIAGGLRVRRCWDIAVVHRLLDGGWAADPGRVWARLQGLDPVAVPRLGQLDLLSAPGDDGGDAEHPVGPDGHLRAEWSAGGWARTPARLAAWAETALRASTRQQERLRDATSQARLTAWSESAAELLCRELAVDGLPVDRAVALRLIGDAAGPPPRDEAHAAALRAERDRAVLDTLPPGHGNVDLRNPAQVRGLLNRLGFDVPDTRSWRLEPFRDTSPVVDALLRWRKSERVATTYGYAWLDANVGADDRLRGAWTSSDGAAGRMTAQAGLHNLPAELRPAVAAEPGHVLVRADLGQIEPRVLAVLSGDSGLIQATHADDLYAPVAARLAVDRPTAKVAVLAAMYGQTSGAAGRTLESMKHTYPAAIGFLDAAYHDGRAGRDVVTVGGRRVRMPTPPVDLDADAERSWRAGIGRFARNAVVQGAAAEFFKMWAAAVRAALADSSARIVLCLHDELLVHSPVASADTTIGLIRAALDETAYRFQGGSPAVRFVVDVAAAPTWADTKVG
jgi:DNA polymerase-1